jgi:6-phosphogluconolactonase
MEEAIALIFADKHKLVKGFTEYFIRLVSEKKGKFRVALSGGSTPRIWFEYLVQNHKDDIDWSQIHFFWGDERCVAPDDPESNYGMTKKYLLDHIKVPEKNIHRIQGEIHPEEAARQYEKELKLNADGKDIPTLDLVILGLGEDGHTASIFPHQMHLWDAKELCVVASHPSTGQRRVSISGRVINNAAAIAFLVTGSSKEEKVKEIIEEEPTASKYPASLAKLHSGTLHWFLDAAAASKLKHDQ